MENAQVSFGIKFVEIIKTGFVFISFLVTIMHPYLDEVVKSLS